MAFRCRGNRFNEEPHMEPSWCITFLKTWISIGKSVWNWFFPNPPINLKESSPFTLFHLLQNPGVNGRSRSSLCRWCRQIFPVGQRWSELAQGRWCLDVFGKLGVSHWFLVFSSTTHYHSLEEISMVHEKYHFIRKNWLKVQVRCCVLGCDRFNG